MNKPKTINRLGRGIFAMLAIGTIPVLFMNPLQYVTGLFVCGIISWGMALVLV